jgi:predicted transcriptional regulator
MSRQLGASKDAAEMNARLLRALSIPERWRILVVLSERPATPKELEEDLGSSLETVARHCRVMRREGLIELMDTDRRRGGKQHIYRAVVRPIISTEMWEQLPKLIREMYDVTVAQDGINDVAAAFAAGTFGSVTTNANVRTPLVLDELGMRKIAEGVEEFVDFLLEVQAESAARLASAGEQGMNVSSWLTVHPSADQAGC